MTQLCTGTEAPDDYAQGMRPQVAMQRIGHGLLSRLHLLACIGIPLGVANLLWAVCLFRCRLVVSMSPVRLPLAIG